MNVLKLWGRLTSINVQKVVWALEELGLAYDRIDAGGQFGIVDTPEYRRLNPNGLVPVLEDDDFVLWESNAIVRYLAAKHPEGGLRPGDLRARADADRWMDWQATAFSPAMRDAFWNLIRTPPDKRDQGAIERSVAAADRVAALLDAHLAERAFLTGEAFTMADIPVGCAAHRWVNLPVRHEPVPHVDAWLEHLYKRPATKGVLVLPVT